METPTQTYRIHITGLVQGVGFRPFIFRLAHERKIKGWVKNTSSGVEMVVNSSAEDLKEFIDTIPLLAPKATHLDHITVEHSDPEAFSDFRILESENRKDEITLVSPDIAVCQNCLEDMKKQPHRIAYPFTNCTNCGPRFTIIRDLPYDRPNTTMDCFSMCKTCEHEYRDILDRRFHAQPVACNACGPEYSLWMGDTEVHSFSMVLEKVVGILEKGGIVAAKGIGGFHLMCDASDEQAVTRLRK